jgi:predicted transcriptional regulator
MTDEQASDRLSRRGAKLLSAVRAAGDQGLSHRSALSLCGRRTHHLAETTRELEAAGLIRLAPDANARKGDRLYAT